MLDWQELMSDPDEARERLARELGVGAAQLAAIPNGILERIVTRIAKLKESAAVDDLTGALRRATGLAALQREVVRARRHEEAGLAVAFLDVNSLKSINDARGHAAGDHVLREVGAVLRRRLRGYDLIIRWGGDEFVCALPRAGMANATRVFGEIAADFSRRTGASFTVGIAEWEPQDTADSLIARADDNLYAVKQHRLDASV
jgi:diguanylate cyclase (GGDEF)-like protein